MSGLASQLAVSGPVGTSLQIADGRPGFIASLYVPFAGDLWPGGSWLDGGTRWLVQFARKDFRMRHGSPQSAAERGRLQSALSAHRFLRAHCGYYLSGQRRAVRRSMRSTKPLMDTANIPTTEESRP